MRSCSPANLESIGGSGDVLGSPFWRGSGQIEIQVYLLVYCVVHFLEGVKVHLSFKDLPTANGCRHMYAISVYTVAL